MQEKMYTNKACEYRGISTHTKGNSCFVWLQRRFSLYTDDTLKEDTSERKT